MSQPASTQICRYFASTGNCFYGNQCNFLHTRPTEDFPPLQTAKNAKAQIPCRNVTIHGYCKYKDKGCEYNHDIPVLPPQDTKPKPTIVEYLPTIQNLNHEYREPPAPENVVHAAVAAANSANPYYSQGGYESKKNGGFYVGESIQGLQYNQGSPNPASYAKAPFGKRRMNTFFMDEELRKTLLKKGQLTYQSLDQNDPRRKEIPSKVHNFHGLVPLDDQSKSSTSNSSANAFGYSTSLFKCFSSADGMPYVIRKIEGFRLANEAPLRMGESWKQINHPNIVKLYEIFISKDLGETNAVFFSYQYFPGSETLESKYVSSGLNSDPLPEDVIWSCILQLFSVIRHVHGMRLAVRCITPSKILVTSKNRFRVGGVAIHDVVNYDTTKSLNAHQMEDFIALGQIILFLCTRSSNAGYLPTNYSIGGMNTNVHKALENIGTIYSADLKNLAAFLLGKVPANYAASNGTYSAVDDLQQSLCSRLWAETENLSSQADFLEGELIKETENGRLFRILVRLGFINERPEFDMDPSWSETGDRYLLKLFRDYVFHQVYEDGSPVVDYAHVVECLNRLDAGMDEKVVLTSRDEQSVLVVSYKDLKRCVLESFGELTTKKQYPNPNHYHQGHYGYGR
eukprot:TRINITY_DN7291_c0_g1_i1.p1 TRINITY_DN7291_c0_g1~~TRINITY_DN7291_c0_g1_i1.p1  ORF type:complete len:626 (-),score=134.46 TRINITY_DN7291_c0_g1_i1:121-1998(-)